jgi:hypothetical protein
VNKPPTRLSIVPFAGVDRRVACLRGVLLAATLLGLLASAPVWFNSRLYPLTPITSWFPIFPAPWDKCLFGLLLATLVAAGWLYRKAVIAFLALSFFAFCEDQNRGQPWLYMYWVMLLLTLFPPPVSIAACRLGMTAVYVWSGLQKCNTRFFKVVPSSFISPVHNWHLPPILIRLLEACVAASPFIEIAIALALWIPGARRPAIAVVALLHLGALLFLGPFARNYNTVVWPWNLAMIGLIWILFSTARFFPRPATISLPAPSKLSPKKSPSAERTAASGFHIDLGQCFRELLRCKPALIIVALFALLPVLSFAGKWDSYFSFALYSENQAIANVFVTKEFGDGLPAEMRGYVKPFLQDYDPVHQGAHGFAFEQWCYETMHVPPLPEPRSFRVMYQFLRTYANKPSDLRMIIGTRSGKVIFYEGDNVEFLEPQR